MSLNKNANVFSGSDVREQYCRSCMDLIFPSHFAQPRTPLEEEVMAVLQGSSHLMERKNKQLTEEEEKALLAMDLQEVCVMPAVALAFKDMYTVRKWTRNYAYKSS